MSNSSGSNPARSDVFATTRWTEVLAARGDSPDARQALSRLCESYYPAVIAFLRSEGRDEDSARELGHEFFARVLQGGSLDGADPRRGRFRCYLLGALKHFLANRRAHELRDKRGGNVIHESLSTHTDTTLARGPSASASAPSDAVFDREWALAMIERALATMRSEASANGSLRQFELLKAWLTGDAPEHAQAEAARELGMTDGAVRVAVHRLRRRFRGLIRTEIASTVEDPADIAAEMEHLIAALS